MSNELSTAAPSIDPDLAWRNSLPQALRPVAERHGRALFEIALNCLGATERLSHMAARIKAADAQQNLADLAQICNNLGGAALAAIGVERPTFDQAVRDIQEASMRTVVAPPPEAIILPPGARRH